MADSKHKANGTVTKPLKDNQFLAWIKLTKTMATDSDGFKNYSDLVQAKHEVEKELEAKTKELEARTKELENLRDEHIKQESDLKLCKRDSKIKCDGLVRTFEERYSVWSQNEDLLQKRNKEIKELRALLQVSEDAKNKEEEKSTQLANSLKIANAKNKEQEVEMRKKESLNESLNGELIFCGAERTKFEHRLKLAEADLGRGVLKQLDETELKELSRQLSIVSTSFHRLVHEFLSDTGAIRNSGTGLDSMLHPSSSNLPLSDLTSKEAVLMSCAAIESFISKSLLKHVFRSFYVPDDIGDAAEIVLDQFDTESAGREIYRYQLLKLFKNDEESVTARVATKATNDIYGGLHSLVLPAKLHEFRKQLSDLLASTVKIWSKQAQYSQSLILAVNPVETDNDLACREVYGKRSESGNVQRSIAVQLFPRILIVNTGHAIHPGIVLWDDQPAVLIAKDQLNLRRATSNGGSSRNLGVRRQSIHGTRVPQQLLPRTRS